jgi:hypothetical protein
VRPRRTLALPPADVKPARDGEFGSATGCLGGRDGAGLTWAVGVMPEGGAESARESKLSSPLAQEVKRPMPRCWERAVIRILVRSPGACRGPAVTRGLCCPTPAPLRRGDASASDACRPTEVQGYRPPARCSILRTAMTDTRIVTTAYRYKRPRMRKAVALAGPANDPLPSLRRAIQGGGHNDGLQTSRQPRAR